MPDFDKFDLTKNVPVTYGNSADQAIAQASGDEAVRKSILEKAAGIFDFKLHKQSPENLGKYLRFAEAIKAIIQGSAVGAAVLAVARYNVLEEAARYLDDVHSISLGNEIRWLKTQPASFGASERQTKPGLSDWVSVNDRMPREGDRVLCYRPTYGEKMVIKEYWYDYDATEVGGVTHWMPAPPAPAAPLTA